MVRSWLISGLCFGVMGACLAAPPGKKPTRNVVSPKKPVGTRSPATRKPSALPSKTYTYQFVSLHAPVGTRLRATRKPSAKEARYLADFMVNTRVGAKPARIHVSCVRKGSRMMGNLTPIRFRDSIRTSVLTGEKVRERKAVKLAGTGMTGEAVRYGAGKTWELFAASPTTSVYAIWRANVPAEPVIGMLNTLRVRP